MARAVIGRALVALASMIVLGLQQRIPTRPRLKIPGPAQSKAFLSRVLLLFHFLPIAFQARPEYSIIVDCDYTAIQLNRQDLTQIANESAGTRRTFISTYFKDIKDAHRSVKYRYF